MLSGAQEEQTMKEQFDLVDKDGDLLITFEELFAVHEAMGVREEDSRGDVHMTSTLRGEGG